MNDLSIPDRRESDDDRRAKPPAVDRRQPSEDKALLILVQQVHADVVTFGKQLDKQRKDEALALAEAVVALTLKAFPEGDADGHRKAHEAQMIAIEARAEFWKKMLFEVGKYGIVGVIGWLVVKVWVAFLAGPNK